MKALSIKPPYAMEILLGRKTEEYRTWKTSHRGDLLICASSQPKTKGCISGHALCVVTLDHIEQFAPDDYEWHLSEVRLIRPFQVKGKLHLYDVEDKLIKYPPDFLTPEKAFARYYKPLIKR